MMKTTGDYLTLLRTRFGVPSDYALRAHTGWKTQQISRYRTEKSSFDDATATKVAEWLNVPLGDVLLDMTIQRSRSDRVKSEWMAIAKKLGGAAATLVICALPYEALVRGVCVLCKIE